MVQSDDRYLNPVILISETAPVPARIQERAWYGKPPFGHLSHTHRILVGVPFIGRVLASLRAAPTP